MTPATAGAKQITRDDIESKLNEIRGGVDDTVGQTQSRVAVVAVVVAVIVVAVLVGRRRGRRRQTIVEIRRI
jgi:hypothetical protein